MKNKIFLLFKNNLINTYKLKKISKKKLILILFAVIYIVFSLFMTIYMLLNGIFDTLSGMQLTNFYIPISFSLTTIFSFFFTIFSAKSGLFDNKDNDLLLSLPVKKSDILTSRLLVIILMNFLITVMFFIPGLYIYLSNVSVPWTFYVSMIAMIIASPIIPTVLASLFGYFVAYITSKAKHKNVIEIICYSLFIIIYMAFMGFSNDLLMKLLSNVTLLTNILKYVFAPIYLISQGISTNNLMYTLYFIIINAVVLFLFIYFLSKKYFNIISKLSTTKTNSNFHMTSLASSSIKKALAKKELKKYFSSAIYVFNTAFGLVFFLIGAIASLFYNQQELLAMISMEAGFSSNMLVFCFMLFVVGFTVTTNSSISIERNSFWILKMLPIKVKDIFQAKTFVNKIITVPLVIVCLIMFMIGSYITALETLLLGLIAIFYNAFIANFGLIVNLALPKLDALNDTVIVKQSAASFVGIMVPVVLAMGFIFIVTTIKTTSTILFSGTALVFLILYLFSSLVLNTWGNKKFKELN